MFRTPFANERMRAPAMLLAYALVGAFSFGVSATRADGQRSLEAGDAVVVALHSDHSAVAGGEPGEEALARLSLTPPEVVIPATITRAYRTADLDDDAPRLKAPRRPLNWL